MVQIAAVLALVGSGRALAQESTPASLPLLTRIAQIRALSQDGGALGYRVLIRATVTHFDQLAGNSLIVHDGELGQWVLVPPDPRTVGTWADLQAGDLIEIEGRTVRGGFAPNVLPEKVRKIGRGVIPRARSVPISAMFTGRYDCDYVEIVGVVQRTWRASDSRTTRVMFAEVATEDRLVRATFWDYAPEDLTRFIDARVRLRGNAGTIFGQTEQLRGVSLFAGRIRDMVVLESAPDPFSLPARSSRAIYNYSSAGEVNRRIRVRGVVTARIPGRPVEVSDFTTTATFRYMLNVLYIKDATGGVRVETEQSPNVRPGQLVEVAGFPAVSPGKPILRNAVFKVVGVDTEPPPLTVSTPSVLTPDHDAELVRMEGRAAERADRSDRARPRAQGGGLGVQCRHRRLAGERHGRCHPRRQPALPHGCVFLSGGSASVVPDFPAVCRRCAGPGGGAVVDAAALGGHGRDSGAWGVHRRVLDARGGEAEAPAVSGRADRAHAGSRASCTIPWSRGSRASRCSSRPWPGA